MQMLHATEKKELLKKDYDEDCVSLWQHWKMNFNSTRIECLWHIAIYVHQKLLTSPNQFNAKKKKLCENMSLFVWESIILDGTSTKFDWYISAGDILKLNTLRSKSYWLWISIQWRHVCMTKNFGFDMHFLLKEKLVLNFQFISVRQIRDAVSGLNAWHSNDLFINWFRNMEKLKYSSKLFALEMKFQFRFCRKLCDLS